MLRAGLIGFGFMGRMHLNNYVRLEQEGFPVRLTSIFDTSTESFSDRFSGGNINTGEQKLDLGEYQLYTDLDEMLDKEKLDFVDIVLPTFLHADTSLKALNNGINVLCEKPMALLSEDCRRMIDAAKRNEKTLMIGQCLRFWPAYEFLKEKIDNQTYGQVTSASFFRGSGMPNWSVDHWIVDNTKSGGCLLDMHVHDTDMIHWLFGLPKSVSTLARQVITQGGYDIVSTNYRYEDGKVVNAQADWTLTGEFGFEMSYRINFEKANILMTNGHVRVNPTFGKAYVPELSADDGYYRELRYFSDCLIHGRPVSTAPPEHTAGTIRIAEAESLSAAKAGEPVWIEP